MQRALIRFFTFIGFINPANKWVDIKTSSPKPMKRVLIRVSIISGNVTTIGKLSREGDWIYELDNGEIGDVVGWRELPE